MSPLRAYRCEAGHEFEVYEAMNGDRSVICKMSADGDDGSSICGSPVERIMPRVQRPIVKGGTPKHHQRSEM